MQIGDKVKLKPLAINEYFINHYATYVGIIEDTQVDLASNLFLRVRFHRSKYYEDLRASRFELIT